MKITKSSILSYFYERNLKNSLVDEKWGLDKLQNCFCSGCLEISLFKNSKKRGHVIMVCP